MNSTPKSIKKTPRKGGSSRKQQIVKVTLDIIGEYGFKGLTTARIAAGVGISEAALYRHFRSKEEILSVTVDTIGMRLMATINEIISLPLSALEKLNKIFFTHLEHIQTNRGVPRVMYTSEVHIEEELRIKLYQIIETYLLTVSEIIQVGQEEKSIRPDMDSEMGAARFLSMIQFTAFRYSLSNFGETPMKEGVKLWNFFQKELAYSA